MRATMLISVVLVGCSGSDTKGQTGETGTPTVDTTDSGDTTDTTDTVTTPVATGALRGTVSGPTGPLADMVIHFCLGTLCRNGLTTADGGYEFTAVPPVWHSFEVVPEEGSGLATLFAPLIFADDEARTLDVTLLPYEDQSPLTGAEQELSAGLGLYVTAAQGDLTPPLFELEATEIAGVRVPEADWVPVDGIAGTVLAMWYVDPFDYTAVDPAGLPVRIDDEWGLPDGTALEVYVGNYAQSAWLDAGPAIASGGSITGAALPNLATVILVQP